MAQDERLKVEKPRQQEIGQQTYPQWSDGPRTTSGGQPQPSARDDASVTSTSEDQPHVEKWSLGILNDKYTEEVPGTVLLLSSNRNEPLGVQHEAARHSGSSMPNQGWASRGPSRRPSALSAAEKKKTADGRIVLEPQPEDSANDPLNWPAWRRDCALLSLGLYCMIGGGMTPILAAGFDNVAQAFDVSYAKVALTTGLYMMGLGVGSVINSPTAILFGKRPVYLFSAVMFVATSIWCAASPSYGSLATARVFQGIAASPVECLPSASIAEIFFLHERAFRIGIYTLLLLSGKNLVPLVSAAILQSLSWRWVFYIAAIVIGFAGILLFFFVPETFWDRTPRPRSRRPTILHRSVSSLLRPSTTRRHTQLSHHDEVKVADEHEPTEAELEKCMTPRQHRLHSHNVHAHFAEDDTPTASPSEARDVVEKVHSDDEQSGGPTRDRSLRFKRSGIKLPAPLATAGAADPSHVDSEAGVPHLHNLNSPYYTQLEKKDVDYLSHHTANDTTSQPRSSNLDGPASPSAEEKQEPQTPRTPSSPGLQRYTTRMRASERKSYTETLKPWNGRVSQSKWWKAALRPFVLYAYPSVLWSALVYSLSIGWLIVLSESVSNIYRNKESYNFSALGTGLVYLSPFVGGVLGTAVAGKVSDVIVQYMASRNGGVYEPEFRLVMAAPVAVTTAIGLMGFGWSAQERDMWIVPTIFFGIISFGCALGSTTAITFCVDSYRQYAGEALVTLNFAKNIFHGLVFSLFFSTWLEDDGPKDVFLAIGGIQVACLLTTIPMYIYGKRSRMWTVRKNLMEKL